MRPHACAWHVIGLTLRVVIRRDMMPNIYERSSRTSLKQRGVRADALRLTKTKQGTVDLTEP